MKYATLTFSWASPVTVAHGGTGTATAFTPGSVVFAGASGTYSQDNANAFWDATNHRLGLGTASPSNLLTLNQSAHTAPATSGTYGLMIQDQGGTNKLTLGLDASYAYLQTFGVPLQLNNQGNNTILNAGGGSVGIGTTSPSYNLVVGPNIASGFINAAMTVSKGASSSASIIVGATSSNLLEFGWDNTNTRGYTNTPLSTPMVWTQDGTNIRLAISSGGNVGIGLSGPTHQLQLSTDDAAKTTTTAWTTTSDVRTKEQIEDFTEGLNTLLKLRPRQFIYNGKAGTPKGDKGVGFVAQEIEPITPDMLRRSREKLNPEDSQETEILKINPHNLQFLLLNSIRELDARLKSIEDRLK